MEDSNKKTENNNEITNKNGLVRTTYILLGISWLFLLIPGFGWLGWILAFVSFILSIVVLAKGNSTKSGILLLLLSIVGSTIVYSISWLVLLI